MIHWPLWRCTAPVYLTVVFAVRENGTLTDKVLPGATTLAWFRPPLTDQISCSWVCSVFLSVRVRVPFTQLHETDSDTIGKAGQSMTRRPGRAMTPDSFPPSLYGTPNVRTCPSGMTAATDLQAAVAPRPNDTEPTTCPLANTMSNAGATPAGWQNLAVTSGRPLH